MKFIIATILLSTSIINVFGLNCGSNEVYLRTTPGCPPTCADPNGPFCMVIEVKPSCQCISGTVRDTVNNRVMGDLYLLDDRMRARIDQLCSQPVWHMRMEVPIQLVNTDQTMMVWAYFIPDFKPKLLTYTTLDNYTSVMAMLWGQQYDATSRVLENQIAKFKSLCCIKRCDCDRCRLSSDPMNTTYSSNDIFNDISYIISGSDGI
ncbi:unnamed protein product [Medioppia subpectinata]|uniref:Uncharacterized protein n=1 Tax=Medioppia subpectinata TaxID=1979941 RepID=A0A7R9Q0L5_9ACAR|nr:unnamed protein product [Medioppia subpectinata]CAG2107452.1 unnamed protein product [Medioppia subpectinata]